MITGMHYYYYYYYFIIISNQMSLFILFCICDCLYFLAADFIIGFQTVKFGHN
jgi:hypothetical protein